MSDEVLLVLLTIGGTLTANYFMTRSLINSWTSNMVEWMNNFVIHYGQHIQDCHTGYDNIVEDEFLDMSNDEDWMEKVQSKEYIESLYLYSDLEEDEDIFVGDDEDE